MASKLKASGQLTKTAILGRVEVSPRVVATVIGRSATECYGIVGMAAQGLRDGIAERLNRENAHRGVQVLAGDTGLTIELFVITQYGTRISEVARNLRSVVRYAVESTTGLAVMAVNVNVQGIHLEGQGGRLEGQSGRR